MKDLLRFCTSGSVDDGKSTLLGRLLYETGRIYDDQLEATKQASEKRGKQDIDLSLLLDGLESEREQGITIDVAYRYFETDKRRFIVADTPGHEQYTRNMVTGASNSNLAIILIDASQGILVQSKRHGFINSLLGIPHLIVAINKMDLVDYSQEVFNSIVEDYKQFSTKLKIPNITFIPISALYGDNCTKHTDKMSWYNGPTILQELEEVHVASTRNLVDFRFPVQTVIRPDHTFRGFAGRLSSGVIRPGTKVTALPSNKTATVERLVTHNGDLDVAFAPQSITITLDKELDIGRGDMLVREGNLPHISNQFVAMMCWMSETSFNPKTEYLIKHSSRLTRGMIKDVIVTIDVNTLNRVEKEAIELNEIFKARIQTTQDLFFDEYVQNRETGGFIVIDPETLNTVACGMITKAEEPLKNSASQANLKENLKEELLLIENAFESNDAQAFNIAIKNVRRLLDLI